MMNPEERRRMQQEVEETFRHLNGPNQEKLLRMAQHFAQHKLLSRAYLGEENPEPCCLCTNLN